jgi:hypothetical protein
VRHVEWWDPEPGLEPSFSERASDRQPPDEQQLFGERAVEVEEAL